MLTALAKPGRNVEIAMARWMTLLLLIGVLSSFVSCASEKKPLSPEALALRARYGELLKIQHFGYITVHVNGDGETIGLNDNDLTDYAKLRFKNNFSRVSYEEVSKEEFKTLASDAAKARAVGVFSCRIWVVGNNYPIAYHVKCEGGNPNNFSIWSDEVLGYGSKSNFPEAVRKSISEMMEKLALIYFKIRGEI